MNIQEAEKFAVKYEATMFMQIKPVDVLEIELPRIKKLHQNKFELDKIGTYNKIIRDQVNLKLLPSEEFFNLKALQISKSIGTTVLSNEEKQYLTDAVNEEYKYTLFLRNRVNDYMSKMKMQLAIGIDAISDDPLQLCRFTYLNAIKDQAKTPEEFKEQQQKIFDSPVYRTLFEMTAKPSEKRDVDVKSILYDSNALQKLDELANEIYSQNNPEVLDMMNLLFKNNTYKN